MSGGGCSVAICRNNYRTKKKEGKSSLAFFRFPKDAKLRKEWIRRCHRKDSFNVETARICSNHFTTKDFVNDVRAKIMGTTPRIRLNQSALPSLLLPETAKPTIESDRNRGALKQRAEMIKDQLNSSPSTSATPAAIENPTGLPSSKESDNEGKMKKLEETEILKRGS